MERARERVAVLLNDVWHRAVVKFGCVSSRILWNKFKFSRVKVCLVLWCGPNEGDGEERERFWNDMDRTLNSVGNRYRLCNLGDLNGWIGDRTKAGITGAFGVLVDNDNGRRVGVLRGKGTLWVIYILSTEVCISTQEWQGVETVWRLRV